MITPLRVPSETWPMPCSAPKPDPVIVTGVPGTPTVGVTVEIVAVPTVRGRHSILLHLDHAGRSENAMNPENWRPGILS